MAGIAFLGTGLIGSAFAEATAKRDAGKIIAWNRTRSRAEPLIEFGVEVVDSAAEAVRGAERIHLAFPQDDVVETVLASCLDDIGPHAVVVDHTTAAPTKTEGRAARLADAGIHYLHAPVFMSPTACLNATGMMLVSGPEDTYQSVAEGLDEMTGTLRYMGPDMRRAAAFKLFGNAMLVAIAGGLADVYTMADELGIAAADALSLFDDFDPTGTFAVRGKNMARGYYGASFELTMARKDVQLMIDAAGERPLAVLSGTADRMDVLIEDGFGDRDLGVLAIDAVPERDPDA